MNIVALATLAAYATRHPETEQALRDWHNTARRADWRSMNDVLASFPKAKVLNGERVRLEICGGNYRLIVAFKFTANIGWVKFVGTHSEYDRIDALTVDQF